MKTFLAALVIGVGVLCSGSNINVASAETKRVDRDSEEHRRWQEEFRRRHGIEENKPAQRAPSNPAPARSAPSTSPTPTTPATPPSTAPARRPEERR